MFRMIARRQLFSTLSADSIKKIGVVGAGQMGTGIAFVGAVRAKKMVVVSDANRAQLDKSAEFVDSLLRRQVQKNLLTQEAATEAKGRFSFTTNLEALTDIDFAVEAVSENTELKQSIFATLDKVMPPHAILSSNTSSISITKLASATRRADRTIGMHFFYPVPVLELVEIVKGLATSDVTTQTTVALAKAMGKTTTTALDVPGFISNRILMPYLNEAIIALQEGIGSAEDIDTTMRLGTNVPMGPLTLADFIGLDTCLNIMKVLYEGLGNDKYAPAPLLRKLVEAGYLGKKSGRGFFVYEQQQQQAQQSSSSSQKQTAAK